MRSTRDYRVVVLVWQHLRIMILKSQATLKSPKIQIPVILLKRRFLCYTTKIPIKHVWVLRNLHFSQYQEILTQRTHFGKNTVLRHLYYLRRS